MCIAILNSNNITFSKSLISNCWENNPDGAGLIWTDTTTRELFTYKELNSVESYYNQYIDIRRKHPKSQIVLHFRISTSGGVNETNTHPFQVNERLAFVHNGIISELNGKEAGRSDTNLFNANYLQHLPADFLENQALTGLIAKFIGGSKLIFLNADNEAHIINPNLGKTDAKYPNCWFSNSTYEESRFYDVGGVKVYKDAHKPKYKGTYNSYSAPSWGQPYKRYEKGDKWNDARGIWETPKATTTPAQAQQAVRQLSWTDASTGQPKQYTATEEAQMRSLAEQARESDAKYSKRYSYLKGKGYATLTQSEWDELQELELYFTPF